MKSLSKVHKTDEVFITENTYILKNIPVVVRREKKPIDEEFVPPEKSVEEIYAAANEEAKRIIDEANEKAKKLVVDAINQAKLQADEIKEEARQLGFEQGKSEGLKQADDIIHQSNNVLSDALEEKYKLLSDLEPEILQFCIETAEKIVNTSIEVDNSKFLSLLENAIRKAEGSEKVRISIHPKFYSNVDEARQKILSQIKSLKKIDIIEDEFLNELDCIIETDCGFIDAGVSSQIAVIKQSFDLEKTAV